MNFSKSLKDEEKSKLIDYLLYQTQLMNENHNLNSENIKPIIAMLKDLKSQDPNDSENSKNQNTHYATDQYQNVRESLTQSMPIDLNVETDQRRKLEILQELIAIKNYEKQQKKILQDQQKQHQDNFQTFNTENSEGQMKEEKNQVSVRIPVNLKEETITFRKPNLESSENKAAI